MAESKYAKYILKDSGENKTNPAPAIISAALEGLKDWAGIQHRINWKYISQPVVLEAKPHSHDFDQFLCFLGSDPVNPQDFGADIELSLGQEGEKHVISVASVTCVPKGLIHCPLTIKKIDKPVLFCNIYLAPEYMRSPVPE